MKVLYFSQNNTTHDRRFLDAIAKQGHELWVNGTSRDERFKFCNFSLLDISALPYFLKSEKIDIVHIGPINSFSAQVSSISTCPTVLMSFASDILYDAESSLECKKIAIQALNHANALITDCDAVPSRIREWIPHFDLPVIKFPWGLDLNRFSGLESMKFCEIRTMLGWEKHTVVISTRSWEEVYGIPTLLLGFAAASAKAPELRLILGNTGSNAPRIFSLINELSLKEKVHCPGALSETDIPKWMKAADLYISSALCDGTSISLLEAMSCELPVIAHSAFGNLEWVVSEINGWLVNMADPQAIESALEIALERRFDWKKIGLNNKTTVAGKGNWEINSKGISLAYLEASRNFERLCEKF